MIISNVGNELTSMTENQVADNRKASMNSNGNQLKAKKVRTPKSCDRCKSRKTKCIDPIPGPCRYCAHIGAECGVVARPKQRPYYHVSEEEYRCSMQILRHFLPQEDLNLETLKSIAKGLKIETPDAQQTSQRRGSKTTDESPGSEEAVQNESEPDTEEIGDLHEQLGCLMQDSLGEYRYVGAYSEIAFNAAVCTMKDPPSPEVEDSKIILPPKEKFPPQKPDRVKLLYEVTSPTHPYLPPREYCDYYVTRFFEEVHCIYWLYPIEQFHARLDDTYVAGSGAATSSWLCSLYAIFALGAASNKNSQNSLINDFISPETLRIPDAKTSEGYLALAKALVPAVHDEADIDSIRALAILSLALLTFKFRITSYLYMGTSMQIAFSLGLQHDKSPTNQSPATKQINRRIWWTLYIMDQEIASRCGSPCVSDERSLRIQTPLPSEQVLSPGTNTPLGCLSVSTSLNRLKREIIQTIYPERSSDSRTISFSKVTSYVSTLQKWLTEMPSHLKWGVPVAPTHRRSIGILHLNYWNAMMLLSQPFLLYLVIKGSALNHPKRTWFEKIGEICIDAARNAVIVLKTMSMDQSLSSLVTFDCVCTLKVIMILALGLARSDTQELRRDVELCVSVLENMEQVGFCSSVVHELPMRLAQLGFKSEPNNADVKVGFADPAAVSNLWPEFDPNDNSYGEQTATFQENEDLGDSFLMDMDLYMNMDMEVSSMQGASDLLQPNLDFFGGLFPGFDSS